MKPCLPAVGMHESDAVSFDHPQQPQDAPRARGCRGESEYAHTDSLEAVKVRTIVGARDDEGILISESADEVVDMLRPPTYPLGNDLQHRRPALHTSPRHEPCSFNLPRMDTQCDAAGVYHPSPGHPRVLRQRSIKREG